MKKVLFIDNTAHHAYGQIHNINGFNRAGYHVIILIPNDSDYFYKLQNHGYECIDSIHSWRGQNPFNELKLLKKLKDIIRIINPDLICTATIKPNLYTALVIRTRNIKQIANITGLGYAFMGGKIKTRIFTILYRIAFKNINQVFFQNNDDYKQMLESKALNNNQQLYVLPGSGVDLEKYCFSKMRKNSFITFLYSGRLLADKGLYELVEAFKKVKFIYPNISLVLIGNYFLANPSAISKSTVDEWIKDGTIKYLGMVDNVSEIVKECDCVVLPSYREGMPRSLLEASSMGRPIITVDSIGCKDVVEDGVTGYMAKVRDVDSLAKAMIKFIELPFDKKIEMGLNGRRKMEQEFDQKIVIQKYLEVANQLLHVRK